MVVHYDEGVELNALFGSLLFKDFEEQSCVLFYLEKTASRSGYRSDEVGADFLRSQWHV